MEVAESDARHDEPLLYQKITHDLELHGYSIQPSALPEPLTKALTSHLCSVDKEQFRPAEIGRTTNSIRNEFVRRNKVFWIEKDQPAAKDWLAWLDGLRQHLNRHLFLGLSSTESQFTLYEKGGFYKRHRDTFKGKRNRVISLVTYLNESWLPEYGGELVLHPISQPSIQVTPLLGTLVFFMSEEIPHEVLVTHHRRFGVATWFRVDEPGLGTANRCAI